MRGPAPAPHPIAAGLSLLLLLGSGCSSPDRQAAAVELDAPTREALDYLAREVPAWEPENGCFSCHDNGDGARALYVAVDVGDSLPGSLEKTTAWLARPRDWSSAGSPFEDEQLARLQFSVALLAATRAGVVAGRGPLMDAAVQLAADQASDGRFLSSSLSTLAAPTTWGPVLGTVLARRVLKAADREEHAATVALADGYLSSLSVVRVPDAAALLLWAADGGRGDANQLAESVELLLGLQSPEGGWGPYVDAPPEAFDTALALLALQSATRSAAQRPIDRALARARRFLIQHQLEDGSWVETTRPMPYESRAQRLSTTAWAAEALLATLRGGVIGDG